MNCSPHHYRILFLAAATLAAIPLSAKTIHVDANAAPGGNGKTWPQAYQHLQDALNDPTIAPGDEVWVAEGTYFPDQGTGQANEDRTSTFTAISGVTIYGGFNNGDPFSKRDPVAKPAILSGDIDQDGTPAGNAYHVLLAGASTSPTIDGFTITSGNADGSSSNANGGGLYCATSANPFLVNCRFVNNSGDVGGAAFARDAAPDFIDCLFLNNTATVRGGGAANDDGSDATFTRCLFANNSGADDAGAVFIRDSDSTFFNCVFSGNAALNDDGGAILNTRSSPLFTNCTFQGNAAGSQGGANPDGGAMFNWDDSDPVFKNCIIWDNAEQGNTGTTSASVRNASPAGSASTPSYTNCLVANLNPGGTNLDGTDPANDPLFLHPTDPLAAPQPGGRLHPAPGSPVLNVGTNAGVSAPDIAGFLRIVGGTADLGAYEFQGSLYVDDTANGTDVGTSWTNAYPTLQQAITTARATGRLVLVAAGTYYPDEDGTSDSNNRSKSFSLNEAVHLIGGFPDDGGDFADRNPKAHRSILSGDIDQDFLPDGDSYHVLTADNSAATSLLAGFHIVRGSADAAAFPANLGGGLLCQSSASPSLVDCTFVDNTAANDGGAVANLNASPTFARCAFKRNVAHNDGGAIHNNASSPFLTECSFVSNSADNDGGGLYNLFSSSPTIVNTTFKGNAAANDGGAVYNFSSSSPTLVNTTLQGNAAANDGGAIYNFSNCSMALVNCSLQGNRAGNDGGAILNQSSAPSLTNTVIWNNAGGGSTGTASASLFDSNSSLTLIFNNNLIEHWDSFFLDSTGTGNLDGTNPANNPHFINPTDPLAAPQPFGDLRLGPGSAAVDAGSNAANHTATDLLGDTRIRNGTIDLGAYEHFRVIHVDHTATGSGDGSSWANAFPLLQDALLSATANEIILVAEGIYYPDEGANVGNNMQGSTFSLDAGQALLGGFPNGGDTPANRDPDAHPTTLSGDIDQANFLVNNAFIVMSVYGSAPGTLVDGFEITQGNGTASLATGGLFFQSTPSAQVSNCDFETNLSRQGGGIALDLAACVTIAHCSFVDNRSVLGGGAVACISGSVAEILHCSFVDNRTDGKGGAIYAILSSRIGVTNSSFEGNDAGNRGGAVHTEAQSFADIVNSGFQGNEALYGGAIHTQTSQALLTNCSFQGNQALTSGGAVYNLGQSLSVLINSVAWNNWQGTDPGLPGSSMAASIGSQLAHHSLIHNWSDTTLDTDGTGNLDGTNPANDPLFVQEVASAPSFGSGDLRLGIGSPVIDAGLAAANPLATDLAGNPRVLDNAIDLGAYEAVFDAATLWNTDLDGDGVPWGVEQALGSDPATPDAALFSQTAVNNSGDFVLFFPHNAAAVPGTEWVLTRSTDLVDFSDEIWRFDGTSTTFVAPDVTALFALGNFTIIDGSALVPHAFYRFEARYTAP